MLYEKYDTKAKSVSQYTFTFINATLSIEIIDVVISNENWVDSAVMPAGTPILKSLPEDAPRGE